MALIGEIIKKYIELRDRKAELAKRHSEEMAPINEAQGTIENYLLHTMNNLGVDSLKENGIGTAFKANSTSCQMQDPAAFKEFVFAPACNAMINQLRTIGFDVPGTVSKDFLTIISAMVPWDMVDFRAGKKGIQEYIENQKQSVPGVAVNTFVTVNIRRA